MSSEQPGWRRIRSGRGFRYVDEHGDPLAPADVERVRALVIPPAWSEVWICPYPRGHLQAVGTDAAGRRQYLYHPHWREQRDLEKFERVTAMARTLPGVRRKLRHQMRAAADDEAAERIRILAAGVRLIDLGCFRPGSEAAVEEHGTHGLTTLERRHVRCEGDRLMFRFVGKAEVAHEIEVCDPDVSQALGRSLARRGADTRVLASKIGGRWRPVTAEELNHHIRDLVGQDVTAKDFRTWHATVTVAVALSRQPIAASAAARKKHVRAAVVQASDLLGNTPTIARSSYVDPRILDLYDSGTVLDPVPSGQDALDRAVAQLLQS